MKTKARITALGSYLPRRVLTNQELERMVDTTDEWIVSRTGIQERRIAGPDEATSDLGAKALLKALEAVNLKPGHLDLIVVCTMTGDFACPSTASLIQTKIGAPHVPAVDLQAACTGFLYGLSMAKAYVESGMAATVAVIASEKMSSVIDFTDRNTCVLFGDGACAAIVQKEGTGLAIETLSLGSDGNSEIMSIPAGGSAHPATAETVAAKQHYFQMNGKEVFKQAVRRMTQAAKECLAKTGLQESDVNWLVPHQANVRIMEALAKQFSIAPDKIYKTIHKYGNTSASSVAIALEELLIEEPPKKGDHLLLVAFGGGLTWGAAVLKQL